MQAAPYLCNHFTNKVATTCGGFKFQTNFYQDLETICLRQQGGPVNFFHAGGINSAARTWVSQCRQPCINAATLLLRWPPLVGDEPMFRTNFYQNLETIGHGETRQPVNFFHAGGIISAAGTWVSECKQPCIYATTRPLRWPEACRGCINVQTNFYQNLETIGHGETR